jgi:hypothetical protein
MIFFMKFALILTFFCSVEVSLLTVSGADAHQVLPIVITFIDFDGNADFGRRIDSLIEYTSPLPVN